MKLTSFFAIIYIVNSANVNTAKETKEKLTVSIIVPTDPFRIRHVNTCIQHELRVINNTNYAHWSYFTFEGHSIMMQKRFTDIIDTLCGLLRNQTNTAIFLNWNDFSSIEALSIKIFMKFANIFNLPAITFVPNTYQTNRLRDNEIQMSPTLYHQAEVIMSILSRYEWFKYSIILTSFYGSDDFLKATESLQYQNGLRVFEILTILKVKPKKGNTKELVKRLRSINLDTRVIVLHCDYSETAEIFAAASEIGMMGKDYMWILTRNVIEVNMLSNLKYQNFPIGALALWSNTSYEFSCKHILADALKLWANGVDKFYNIEKSKGNLGLNKILPTSQCNWKNRSNNRVNSSDDYQYKYGKEFHRLLLESPINATIRNRSFTDLGILNSVDFIIKNVEKNYMLKDVGRWVDNKLLMEDIVWPGAALRPPNGRPIKFHLKIVTLEEPPFVIYKLPTNNECFQNSVEVKITEKNGTNLTQCATGFYIDLLLMLKERLEFTFDMYEVEDGKWGSRLENNVSWNGLIGDLIVGKADMVMTSLKITHERSQVLDFSVPFMETGIAIIVALRAGAISTTAFLKPYDYLSWIMILLVALHSVAIFLYLFEWLRDKLTSHFQSKPYLFRQLKLFRKIQNGKNKNRKLNITNRILKEEERKDMFSIFKIPTKQPFTFGNSIWLVWVLLFRAATEVVQPRGFTSKFIASVWALCCMAFMASYTANLAAFMVTKEEYHDFRGIEDDRLMHPTRYNPKLRFGTVKHGSTEEVLKINYPKMFDYMKEFMEDNISNGIKAVKDNKIDAFIYDAVVLDYRSGQDDSCKLRVVGNWYSMTGYGIAFNKSSKYKDMVDRKLLEYAQTGELERSQRFWFSGTCKNKVAEDNGQRGSGKLGLLNFTSAFLLLAGGILLSVIIHLLNYCYHKLIHDKLTRTPAAYKSKMRMLLENARVCDRKLSNINACKNPECCNKIKRLESELKALLVEQKPPCKVLNGTSEHRNCIESVRIESESNKDQFNWYRSFNRLPTMKPPMLSTESNSFNDIQTQINYFYKKRLELETVL